MTSPSHHSVCYSRLLLKILETILAKLDLQEIHHIHSSLIHLLDGGWPLILVKWFMDPNIYYAACFFPGKHHFQYNIKYLRCIEAINSHTDNIVSASF